MLHEFVIHLAVLVLVEDLGPDNNHLVCKDRPGTFPLSHALLRRWCRRDSRRITFFYLSILNLIFFLSSVLHLYIIPVLHYFRLLFPLFDHFDRVLCYRTVCHHLKHTYRKGLHLIDFLWLFGRWLATTWSIHVLMLPDNYFIDRIEIHGRDRQMRHRGRSMFVWLLPPLGCSFSTKLSRGRIELVLLFLLQMLHSSKLLCFNY